jgi:hypothetical protein
MKLLERFRKQATPQYTPPQHYNVCELLSATSQQLSQHAVGTLRVPRTQRILSGDWDGETDRSSHMTYHNAALYEIDSRIWVIARGSNEGSRTSSYRGDIIAACLGEHKGETLSTVEECIKGSAGLRNSLLLESYNGSLVVPTSRPTEPLPFTFGIGADIAEPVKALVTQSLGENCEEELVHNVHDGINVRRMYAPDGMFARQLAFDISQAILDAIDEYTINKMEATSFK